MTEQVYAIIENELVRNVVVSDTEDAAILLKEIYPEIDGVILVNEPVTGAAFIGGGFKDGKFMPPKPYDSWVFDDTSWYWKAPVAAAALDLGEYAEWNETTLSWDIKKAPIIEETPAE